MGARDRTGWKKSLEFRRRNRPGALTSPRWFSKGNNGCGRAKGRFETLASSRWSGKRILSRAAPSPRLLQPYSPRRPSPLGLPPLGFNPPLAPHIAFQSPSYPLTPERHIQPKGPSEARVPFPPEARRPLAGTQRPRSQPVLPPLTLNNQYHPPTQPQQPGTTQPGSKQGMSMHVSPPSPTPSDTSSLSLYSADSVNKNFPIDVVRNQQEEEKPPALFCGCINFKSWFSSKKAKEKRILGPPVPAPPPQTVQVRRRPPPLNM